MNKYYNMWISQMEDEELAYLTECGFVKWKIRS